MWKSILHRRKSSTNLFDKNSNERRTNCSKSQSLLTRPDFTETQPNRHSSKEFSTQTNRGALKISDIRIINVWPRWSSSSTADTQTNFNSTSASTQTLNLDERLSKYPKLCNTLTVESLDARENFILTKEMQNQKQNLENLKVKDMINSLETQMNCISLSTKSPQNSADSTSKQKRSETGPRNLVYPDEKLRIVTEKLIKELERVQQQGVKHSERMSNLAAANSKTLAPPTQLDSAINQCSYGGDPHIEFSKIPNHNKLDPNKLSKKPNLGDKKTSGVRRSPGRFELNELDWLEMIRRVTHDKTLTSQKRDEELDRIAETLIERRNGLSDGI